MFLEKEEQGVSPGVVRGQRNDLLPLSEAARRYIEAMNPSPAIPSAAQVDAVAHNLARRLPVFRLADGTVATTIGALDSYIALKRYS